MTDRIPSLQLPVLDTLIRTLEGRARGPTHTPGARLEARRIKRPAVALYGPRGRNILRLLQSTSR